MALFCRQFTEGDPIPGIMSGARGSFPKGSVNPNFRQVTIKSDKKSVDVHMLKNVDMQSVKDANMERLESPRPVPPIFRRADEFKFWY